MTLAAGERYMFAVTHREGGGGSGIHAMFKTPSMAAETTIKPGDPDQQDMWWTDGYGNVDALTSTPVNVVGDAELELMSDAVTTLNGVTLSNGTLVVSGQPTGALTVDSTAGDGGLDCALTSLEFRNASTLGTLTMSAGGLLVGAELAASTKFSFEPNLVVSNVLSGMGEVHIGDADADPDGREVFLTATNSYTGDTRIERGILCADEGVGLPVASRVVFNQINNNDQAAVLQTRGTFARNIGTGTNEVYWERDDRGGFAAEGGDLIVTLENGAQLVWDSGTEGFNSSDALQFGSITADGKVELTNPIDIQASWQRIQVQNNPGTKGDFVRLSGAISGNSGAQELRFNENSAWNFYDALVELTGTNTYTQRTRIDDATVYAIEGVGLPVNSRLQFSGNSDARPAVLMSVGTMNRNIGAGDGEVNWDTNTRGGFAARGGTFTVTLEGGSQLDWSSADTGFNGRPVQLNSDYADSVVELTNPIDLNAADRWFDVFDNPDTTNDYAILSGSIAGTGDQATELWKRRTGTLVLTATNTYSQRTVIDSGILRAQDGIGIPTNSTVLFDEANYTLPCIWEANGRIERDVGLNTDLGVVSWDWQHGGFAAFGGPLNILLEGGATLSTHNGDPAGGFDNHFLHLGSRTATDVVTLENDIEMLDDAFQMRLFDNPDRTDDYAVMSGNITESGWGDMEVRGEGLLKMTGNNAIRNFRVYDTARVEINGTHTGSNEIFTENLQNGTIAGTGTVTVVNRFDIRDGGTLAPGVDAGTLTVTIPGNDGFRMYAASTYEWELGPIEGDRVDVTGKLELRAGWTLKLAGGPGTPRPDAEYTLFSYTESAIYSDPVIDASAMPADWDASSVTVVHDAVGKRVYLTGLYSPLGILNDLESNLTDTSAQINGWLSNSGQVMGVWAYWGLADGGTDAGSWSNSTYIGSYSNVIGEPLAHSVTGLPINTTYYYTYRATNATYDLWAAPSVSFMTLGPPIVENDGVTKIVAPTAKLAGRFLDHNRADLTLCWGLTDGGTNSVGAWEYSMSIGTQSNASFSSVVNPVYYGQTYWYRCYAVSPYGSDWSDAAASFLVDGRTVPVPGPSGPIGYWSFDDSGYLGYDGSENGNDGVAQGDATYDPAGVLAGALTTDGTGDFLNCGDGLAIANGNFSVSFWAKRDTTTEDYVVGHSAGQGDNNTLHVGFRDADTFTFAFWGNDLNYDNAAAVGDLTNYHHWVCTYDANVNQQLVYLDGATTPVSIRTAGADFGGTRDLYIGTRNNDAGTAACFDGLIDEVYVYDRTLTPAEAAELHAATNPAVGYWVDNELPTDVTTDSAMLHADVGLAHSVYDVWVYWGTTDGTNNASAWATNAFLGTFTNHVGDIDHAASLVPSVTNYYAFRATNALDEIWGMPSTVVPPVILPVVNNDAGAITDVGTATLRGELTAGGFADVYVYWGLSDGGTNAMAWDSAVPLADLPEGAFDTDVVAGYGETYHYRCYATNAAGMDWADSTAMFTTALPVHHYRAGLLGTHTNGNMYLGTANDGNLGFVLGPYGGRSGAEHWSDVIVPDNSTLFYEGQIYLPDTPVTFVKCIDDRTRIVIDGLVILDNGTWNDTMHVTVTNTAGWHDFDLRFSNGGGGYGPAQQDGWAATFGFGLDVEGRDTEEETNFVFPEDPGDRTLFRVYDPAYSEPIETSLSTDSVTDRTTNSAVINGTLAATGWVFRVYAMYGESDGGTVFGDWDGAVDLGYVTNVNGTISATLTGLVSDTDYWCAFHATNSVTNLWGDPALTFQVMGMPTIENAAATDITQTSATLNGDLVGGGVADVTVYWGLVDGGTDALAWANTNMFGATPAGTVVINVDLLAGGTYYYRYYATNALGADWADTTETFQSTLADLTIADTSLAEGDAGQSDMTISVTLSALSASNVVVNFATSDGSAAAGVDYAATNGVLTIPVGATGTQITVTVYGDTTGEYPSESFQVTLSSPVNAAIGDGTATGTIVDDDFAASLGRWSSKMKIIFSGYAGTQTLTNFPAVVAFDTSIPEFEYNQFASMQGLDLRFSDALQQELNYEIERWDTNGTSHVWVQVPELVDSSTYIWAYWGNEDATTAPPYTTNGAVWSDGFEAVWHAGEAGTRIDSTANGKDGTPAGGVASSAGVIAAADEFNGMDSRVDFPNDFGLFTGDTNMTVSFWFNPDLLDGNRVVFSAQGENNYLLTFSDGRANDEIGVRRNNGGWGSPAWAGPLVANNWYYFTTTRGDLSGYETYLNGGFVMTVPDDGTHTVSGTQNNYGSLFNQRWFDGTMDEIRISSVIRSADWVQGSYSNQVPGSTFVSYADLVAPKGMVLIIR